MLRQDSTTEQYPLPQLSFQTVFVFFFQICVQIAFIHLNLKLNVVVCAYNPSIWEIEAGEWKVGRPVWTT
jgi:hypothetical protein